MANVYDKNRIPIEIGDILKVFHFTGARRKRHYMYKQALTHQTFGGEPFLVVSHLNFVDAISEKDGPYVLPLDESVLSDYEIVQSIKCDHEDRKKK